MDDSHLRTICLCFIVCIFFWSSAAVSAEQVQSADRQGVAAAQIGAPSVSSDTSSANLVETLRQGIQAYESESYARARGLLLHVFSKEPLLRPAATKGTAAYYLGKTLDARAEHEVARNVWLVAIRAASSLPDADVRSADAYVRNVFQSKSDRHYAFACESYLRLVQWIGDNRLAPAQRAIVRSHHAQMKGLRPDLGKMNAEANAGEKMAAWWRSVDPKAGTLYNERIIEHLERVSFAEREYGSKKDPDKLDDRGEIYVRLGAPTNQTSVDFFTPEILRRLRDLRRATGNHLQISPSDFADNEFWLYNHDDVSYYYLFVNRGDEYVVGKTTDLIPQGFMAGAHSSSGRGGAKIDVALEVLRAIYEQLARYHPDFGTRFNEISDYVTELEIEKRRAETQTGQISEFISNRKRGDYSEVVQQTGFMNGRDATQLPQSFVRRNFERARRDAERAAYQRELDAPTIRTETTLGVPALPAAMRPARFLNEDGSTRVELFWGVAPGSNTRSPMSQSSMVEVSINQYAPDYRIQQHHRQAHAIPEGLQVHDLVYPSAPVVIDSLSQPFHLKLQWDHHAVQEDETGEASLGALLRSSNARVDSLRPLSEQSDALGMSDLVPLLLDPSSPISASDRFVGKPFPFERIPHAADLGLYFEIYHLAFGGDDQTSYDIDYEVRRETKERGIIRRVFSGTDVTRTTTSSSYKTSTRRAEESIVIDTSAWKPGERVTLTVRVLDNVTGQTFEREETFVVGPSR